MSILKVAQLGHPVLRTVAEPIEPGEIKDGTMQRLIDDMFETMDEYSGVGLAAPQVHRSIRLFVTEAIPDPDREGRSLAPRSVFINPEITFLIDDEIFMFEGCLSIPDLRGNVARIKKIRIRALDREGQVIDRDIEGFPSVVCQHELDHLNGVMFLDRMRDLSTLTYLKEYEKFFESDDDG